MKLYFIRHGQSQANLNHFFAGQTQVTLTEQGRNDARRAGQLLQSISFDRVYSSDLIRAMETRKIALPDAEAISTPLLREIDVGALEGYTLQQCLEKFGEAMAENRAVYDFTPYGGENVAMVRQRLRSFLQALEDAPCDRVAVFAHAALGAILLEMVLGGPIDKHALICENGSVAVFEFTGGRWRLLKWNYTGEI